MAPKRNAKDLPLKSIWDEELLAGFIKLERNRTKLVNFLVNHSEKDIKDVPFKKLNIASGESEDAIVSSFVKFTTNIQEKKESARGDSTKLIIRLQDGHLIETVIMKHRHHATVCVSSQVGCQMGCKFCATGTMGIIGDLTSGEIIEQLVHANMITKIRNVVFMGMGEPLNNYDNVKKAVEFMIDNQRLALSSKHVSISTVGVIKNMKRMADEMPSVSLALSLHAPNQETRLKIVPSASAYTIEKLMQALDYNIQCSLQDLAIRSQQPRCKVDTKKLEEQKNKQKNKKATQRAVLEEEGPKQASGTISAGWHASQRSEGWDRNKLCVMLEYILIGGVNDSVELAHELGALLQSRKKYILLNLIPYNPTDAGDLHGYKAPSAEAVAAFHNVCISEPYNIYCRTRQEKGQDIDGACGQLVVETSKSKKSKLAASTDIEDIGIEQNQSLTNTQRRAGQSKDHNQSVSLMSGLWTSLTSSSFLGASCSTRSHYWTFSVALCSVVGLIAAMPSLTSFGLKVMGKNK